MYELMQQGLTLSAKACFTKPLDIDRFLSTIKEAIQSPTS